MEFEKDIEHYLKHRVEHDLGGLCLKLSPDVVKGLPDRMMILPGGRVIFVELKRKTGKLSALQMHQHRKLRELGVLVHVVWTKHQVDDLVESIADTG